MRATFIILPPFEYYSQRNKFHKIFHVVVFFLFFSFFYLYHFSVDASGWANTAERVEVVQLNRPLSVVPLKPFITPVGRCAPIHPLGYKVNIAQHHFFYSHKFSLHTEGEWNKKEKKQCLGKYHNRFLKREPHKVNNREAPHKEKEAEPSQII